MKKYFDSIINEAGRPVQGVAVTVFNYGTVTPASLFSDSAGSVSIANPVSTDLLGYFEFYAADGRYTLSIAATSYTTKSVTDILLDDPASGTDVGYLPAGTGAVATTVQSKLRQTISVKDFGAAGDGSTDDRAAIQLTINAASASGKFVYVPAGTYRLTKGALQTDEAGSTYPCLTMASNMHIFAEPGATFKLADSQSTDGTPTRLCMFFSNSVLSNISFRNLTIDMNGANNKISPSRPTTYNVYTQAHILFSGTPAGVAAAGNNVLIDGCQFINTAGVTCIGMAQSNSTGVTLGKRWRITNCLFNNNGLDTEDHSSVFGWADDVYCAGNTFTSDTMYPITGKAGCVVAFEVHGANTRFIGNNVKNYYQGLWIAPNLTSTTDNVIVSGNSFFTGTIGIDFYRQSATEAAISKVVIADNAFAFDDVLYSGGQANKVGVQINTFYTISSVLIANNTFTKTGSTTSANVFSIGVQNVVGQKHTGITIKGNQATGFSIGAIIATNATVGLGQIEIANNTFKDFVPASSGFTTAIGISVAGTTAIDQLNSSNNTFISTTGTWQYGHYMSGLVTRQHMGPQSYVGLTTNYFETGFTATNRDGFFDSVAFTPTLNTWTNTGSPTFTGTTWSRYGKTVSVNIVITPATNVSATLITSTITGLPFTPLTAVIGSAAIIGTGAALNNFVVTSGGVVYPPTTGVTTSQIGFSFTYQAA